MGRVADYIRFAIGLLGVGYVTAWPLIAHDGGGPIGAALICPSLLGFLCDLPHPLALPPGLHWIGFLSAGWIGLMLLWRLTARLAMTGRRRMRAAASVNARIPAAVLRRPRRKPLTPLRPVKPRRQFGLRGRPE